MFKKIVGLFSSSNSTSSKEVELEKVDPLDLLQQNLDKAKAEAKAIDEFENKKKEEELKLLERKAKFKSIEQELERTFDSMSKGARRVRKIEKRIAALRDEEQENLQQHFDRAAELRRRFEASLYEEDDDEETPPVAPAPAVPVPPAVPVRPSWVCPQCNHPNPAGVGNCEACSSPAPGVQGRGPNPNVKK